VIFLNKEEREMLILNPER